MLTTAHDQRHHSAYFSVFDVVVSAENRRQGYGRELTESLLAWAIDAYAHTAYLQVMVNNQPAQALYAQLRFQEKYRYWYRSRPTSSRNVTNGDRRKR